MNFPNLLFVLVFLLTGCTSNIFAVYHRFEFDLRWDGQHALILDYRYMYKDRVLESGNEAYVHDGSGFKLDNSGIFAPRGTSLYVKWRDELNGLVYQDDVNLSEVLPFDMLNKTIYLMIRGPQLYIYIVPEDTSENRRPKDDPPIGPAEHDFLKTIQVYPLPSTNSSAKKL